MTDGGRFVCRAALLATGLVLAAWVAIVVEHRVRRGPLRGAWAQTIAEMRSADEPVELEDLRGPTPVADLEFRAWLERFQRLATGRPVSSRFIANSLSNEFEVYVSSTRALRVAVAQAAGGSESWEVLQEVLEGTRAWKDLVASGAADLAPLRASESALFAELASIDAIRGVDVEAWMQGVLDPGPGGASEVFIAKSAADLLAVEALLAAADEDPVTLEAALRRLLVLRRQIVAVPTLVQNRLGGSILDMARLAIEGSADRCSRRFVVDELEPAIAAIDLRGDLVRAMRGETLALIASPVLRTSLDLPVDLAPEELAVELDMFELESLHDELERRREVTEAFELPFVDGKAAIAAVMGGAPASLSPGFHAPLPSLYFGRFAAAAAIAAAPCEELYEQTVARELALAFTRLRLRARVAGVAGARELAATLVDPYDGKPLRVRATGEGKLVVWSVGPDGVDQSGAAATGIVAGDDVQLELPEE